LELGFESEHHPAKSAYEVDAEEMLPEYDFSRAIPNKLASRYASDNVAVLDPERG